MSFIIIIASAESFFRCQGGKKSCYLLRCKEVILFRDTGAIAVLSSSHCLGNVRRVSLLPSAFSLLKYLRKIVFLSIRVRFFFVILAELGAHAIIIIFICLILTIKNI